MKVAKLVIVPGPALQHESVNLSGDRFKQIVARTKKAMSDDARATFAQIKTKVLANHSRSKDIALIEKNWVKIEHEANRGRFEGLLAVSHGLVEKYSGKKVRAVKQSGQKDFFCFLIFELEKAHKREIDFVRIKEISAVAVATALRQVKVLNEAVQKQEKRDCKFDLAAEVVRAWVAESDENRLKIFGDRTEVANQIFADMKPETSLGMLRRQVIDFVKNQSRDDKLNIFFVIAKKTVEGYFTMYPKDLFRKRESKDQFRELVELIRSFSPAFVFVGRQYDAVITISRALSEKRYSFQQKKKQELEEVGFGRIAAYMENTGPKKKGSARRRYATRFPDGNYPESSKDKRHKEKKHK